MGDEESPDDSIADGGLEVSKARQRTLFPEPEPEPPEPRDDDPDTWLFTLEDDDAEEEQ